MKNLHFRHIFQLWDVAKIEGTNLVNRAFAIFDVNEGSPLTTAAVSNESPGYNQNLLATGSEDGKVVVTR